MRSNPDHSFMQSVSIGSLYKRVDLSNKCPYIFSFLTAFLALYEKIYVQIEGSAKFSIIQDTVLLNNG